MELNYTKEELEFRDEVRQLLRDELTPRLSQETKIQPLRLATTTQRWLGKRFSTNEVGPVLHGQKSLGGQVGHLIKDIFSTANVRKLAHQNLSHLGSGCLHRSFLSTARKSNKIIIFRKCSLLNIIGCQGYSEPGSGSDLASLKTRAERDGGLLRCQRN